MLWMNLLIVLLAGAMLPLQAGINAQLARGAGHSLWAAGASFAVGMVILVLLYTVMRLPWPSLGELRALPLWSWSGGLLGAFYVSTMIILAPKLGAATLLALAISGQMLASVLLDHFGVVGFSEQPINVWRALGILLLVAGAILIRKF